jgi:hypothetical protein
MKRREGESFEGYRVRRLNEQLALRAYLRGRVVWDSYSRGTYIKKRYGELK